MEPGHNVERPERNWLPTLAGGGQMIPWKLSRIEIYTTALKWPTSNWSIGIIHAKSQPTKLTKIVGVLRIRFLG